MALAQAVKEKDTWFFQEDVERNFAALSDATSDLICVFESRESYVEFLYSHCVPIPNGRFKKTCEYLSWGLDITRSKALIVRRTAFHFLSRAFRNRTGIEPGERVYISIQDRRVVARRELSESPSHRYDRILVSRKLVKQFLEQTSQRLLWCVRSIRYSERALEEFGVESYEQHIRDEVRHYMRQARPTPPGGTYDRPRMKSLTYIFGKRALPEVDRNI